MGGFERDRLDRLREAMAGHVEQGTVCGAVTAVSRDGEVHIDAYGTKAFPASTATDAPMAAGPPMSRDTIFRISSMTKPITAVATLILVEEGRCGLDDPVGRWLPELAEPRVLRSPDAEIDDTVPIERPITVRDLLTFTWGSGQVLAMPGTFPIQDAMEARLGRSGPPQPGEMPPTDAWMAGLGTLPLIRQPGTCWMYNTGSDVLGVLIERVVGRSLETVFRERIFEPLGMVDTGFSVPAADLGRLATSYVPDAETGLPVVYDPAEGGQWSRPPAFASGAGGLVSTVDDYLAFARMLLAGGSDILAPASVQQLSTDQLTAEQKAAADWVPGAFDTHGWGFGVSVRTRSEGLEAEGQYGWAGGMGTSWANDPQHGLIGMLLTQGMWTSPHPPPICADFWAGAYQALD